MTPDDGFVVTAFLTRRFRQLARREQVWPRSVVSGYKTRGINHLRSTGKCFREQYATKLNKDGPSVSHGVF
jgi:hypothetical protein